MAEKRLTDEVLRFDNTANRRLSPAENAEKVGTLLHIVDSYVRNGSLPMQHDVVYGLRVAGELSGLDENVATRILEIGLEYNARASPGECIPGIDFYRNALSKPEIINTLCLRDVESLGGK